MNTKTCFKCGFERDITDFYRHPRMADGYLNKCKDCTKRDVQQNYQNRRDQYIAYERKRRPSTYPKDTGLRLTPEERQKRKRACWTVQDALRAGRLVRETCAICGDANVQAHHEDYDKALDVVWLCIPHHHQRHSVVNRLSLPF